MWQTSGRKWSPGRFSFCLFPFIFDSKSKATLLRVESQITQVSNAQVAQQQNIRDFANQFMGGQGGRFRQPHLMLEVSRDNIVHDTVHQIERIIFNESNGVMALRKPLLGMMFFLNSRFRISLLKAFQDFISSLFIHN